MQTMNIFQNIIVVVKVVFVLFSDTVQPIALPTGSELNELFLNWNATVSGYGLTGDGKLAYFTLTIIMGLHISILS